MKEKNLNIPWRALTLLGALLLIWIIFTATTGGTFVTPRNLSPLLRQMSCTSILAIGMVLVIVCGVIRIITFEVPRRVSRGWAQTVDLISYELIVGPT